MPAVGGIVGAGCGAGAGTGAGVVTGDGVVTGAGALGVGVLAGSGSSARSHPARVIAAARPRVIVAIFAGLNVLIWLLSRWGKPRFESMKCNRRAICRAA